MKHESATRGESAIDLLKDLRGVLIGDRIRRIPDLISRINAVLAVSETRATEPEPVPLFGQPEALLAFLESAGAGCISGNVSEWPQLRPACRWAVEQIKATPSATRLPDPVKVHSTPKEG